MNENEINKVEKVLEHVGDCLGDPDLRFNDPECAQLAADTYQIPVDFHGPTFATLYLPLIKHTRYYNYRPIVLNLFSAHIYLVTLKRGSNYGYPNHQHDA